MCADRNHQTLTKPIVSRVSTFHQGRQRRKHRRRRWRSWFVSRILFSAFSSHSSHISIHLFDYCGSGWNWRLRLNDDQSGRLKAKHDEYESDCVFHSSWDYSGRLWHFSKEKRIEKDGGVVGIDTKGEESSWPVKGTFWCQKRRWETSEKEEKNQRINPVDILSKRLESLPPHLVVSSTAIVSSQPHWKWETRIFTSWWKRLGGRWQTGNRQQRPPTIDNDPTGLK